MNTPTVTIQLQGMRETIVAALANYNDDLTKMVQEELDRQLVAFDLTAYIREEVNRCLKEMVKGSLQRHMSYTLEKEIADEVEKTLAERIIKKYAA